MKLTPEERAAIEAFTGEVKRIPRGTSGLPDLRWCDKSNAVREINDDETFVSRKQALERGKKRFFQRNRSRPSNQGAAAKYVKPVSEETWKRRAFVEQHHAELSIMEMSRRLKCDKKQIRKALDYLGVEAARANRTRAEMVKDVRQALARGVHGSRAIARECRLRNSIATEILKELNQ